MALLAYILNLATNQYQCEFCPKFSCEVFHVTNDNCTPAFYSCGDCLDRLALTDRTSGIPVTRNARCIAVDFDVMFRNGYIMKKGE